MCDNMPLTLRIRGPNGMTRISISSQQTVYDLYRMVGEECPELPENWSLSLDGGHTKPLPISDYILDNYHIKNGEMLYINIPTSNQSNFEPKILINEHDVDKIIEKKQGLVYRERTPNCNHNAGAQCINCSPYQIFDDEYLKTINPPLKHISLHTYIRKVLDTTKNKNIPLFDEIKCTIKKGCQNHPPWPQGVCTQCQPPPISLSRQEFRNIDNIMFESHDFVDDFIGFWRKSRHQRIGYLYGTYEPMDNIPLGIRAHVYAIYEPPQINSFDSVSLKQDDDAANIDEVAALLGYTKIGIIISDLLIGPDKSRTVMHTRDLSTYLLSAQECITAAHFQNMYPNPCKYSSTGYFGSKFVTVIVTGNDQGNIDFYGWQVSNQCMALFKNDCLVPTIDEPSLAYVRDPSPTKFIPDVYYKGTDEFKNEVQTPARPVPVVYFLVEIPTGFPVTATSTGSPSAAPTFPNFNRGGLGEHQRISVLKDRLSKSSRIEIMSNFNVLCFIYPFLLNNLKEIFKILCQLISKGDKKGLTQFADSKEFEELVSFILNCLEDEDNSKYNQKQNNGAVLNDKSTSTSDNPILVSDDSQPASLYSDFSDWQCSTCTYINTTPFYDSDNMIVCEICGLPKI